MSFKMMDMLETPKEQRQEGYAMPAALSMPAKPCYPYGLCLTLNDATLKKLGIDTLPEVGEMIHLMAMAKVTATGTNATEDQSSRRVELQITHLALEDEDDESSVSDKLYDKNDAEEEQDE